MAIIYFNLLFYPYLILSFSSQIFPSQIFKLSQRFSTFLEKAALSNQPRNKKRRRKFFVSFSSWSSNSLDNEDILR